MILEIAQLLVDLALVVGLLHLWRRVRRLEKKPPRPIPAAKGSSVPVDVVTVLLALLACSGAFAQPPVELKTATGIDADEDGTRELTCTPGSTICTFAPAENSIEVRIQNFGGGAPWLQLSDGSNTTGFRLYSGLSRVTYGASEVWGWGSGAIVSLASGSGFRLDLDAPSATAATFMPNQGDTDTGIGHAGGDDLRLIAGGSSGLGVTTTAVTNYRAIHHQTPEVNAPATCTIGDSYVDSSGAYCACVSTNTWENTVSVGSCT